MPVRPPSDIHLTCTADAFESTTWTDAWGHILDVHRDENNAVVFPNWELLGTLPE